MVAPEAVAARVGVAGPVASRGPRAEEVAVAMVAREVQAMAAPAVQAMVASEVQAKTVAKQVAWVQEEMGAMAEVVREGGAAARWEGPGSASARRQDGPRCGTVSGLRP